MSRLYNYFVSCWTINPDFTVAQLDTTVVKGYITAEEKALIEAIPKAA